MTSAAVETPGKGPRLAALPPGGATAQRPASRMRTATVGPPWRAGRYDVIRKRLLEQAAELAAKAETLNDAAQEGLRRRRARAHRQRAHSHRAQLHRARHRERRRAPALRLPGLHRPEDGDRRERRLRVLQVREEERGRRRSGTSRRSRSRARRVPHRRSASSRSSATPSSTTKDARLLRLKRTDTRLLAVVQIGATARDAKVFRWAIDSAGRLTYMDARGDEEVLPPKQHDFEWTPTAPRGPRRGPAPARQHPRRGLRRDGRRRPHDQDREQHQGRPRHLSRAGRRREPDARRRRRRVGEGRHAHPPPREAVPRGRSTATSSSTRARSASCASTPSARPASELPEDHGIVFPGGYYLQSGDYKVFEGADDGPRVRARAPVAERRGRALRLPSRATRASTCSSRTT